MKKLLLFSSVIVLVLVSCQKEIDWGLGGNGNTAKLLVKIKSQTGTDTTQVDYTYDANRKLIREKTAGMSTGTNLDNDLVINRNSSGIITTTVQKSAAFIAAGIDSIVTTFNYSTASSKYIYSVFMVNAPGLSVTDSVVYSYDAGGRISGDADYLQINGLPIPVPPVLSLKNYYIYSASGSNMDSVKQDASTTPGGPLSPASSQAYNFDARTNPLIILNEAVLLGRPALYSANNATKSSVTNIIAPANDFTMDYTYKYNSANRPDSAYSLRTPGLAVTATKYYYQ